MSDHQQNLKATKLAECHEALIDYLRQGKFAEGIDDFYAADVVAQENGNPSRSGRDALAKAEREYLAGVTRYDGIQVHQAMIRDDGNGDGVVMYECEMKWHHETGGEVHVQQAVVEHWKAGKVKNIRFYGTFQP